MKKLLLTLMLAVVSSSVMAEWVFVAETEKEDSSTFYADPDTIRKSGDNVKIWVLTDFTTLKLDFFISARKKYEYDCRKKQFRILFAALYSEHMGGGETVSILNGHNEWKWESIPPYSVAEAMLEYACRFLPTPLTFPEETFS